MPPPRLYRPGRGPGAARKRAELAERLGVHERSRRLAAIEQRRTARGKTARRNPRGDRMAEQVAGCVLVSSASCCPSRRRGADARRRPSARRRDHPGREDVRLGRRRVLRDGGRHVGDAATRPRRATIRCSRGPSSSPGSPTRSASTFSLTAAYFGSRRARRPGRCAGLVSASSAPCMVSSPLPAAGPSDRGDRASRSCASGVRKTVGAGVAGTDHLLLDAADRADVALRCDRAGARRWTCRRSSPRG